MDQPIRLQFLFDRYLSGTCSPEEVEELVHLLRQEGADLYLDERMRALWRQSGDDAHPVDWDRMLEDIQRSDAELSRLSGGRGAGPGRLRGAGLRDAWRRRGRLVAWSTVAAAALGVGAWWVWPASKTAPATVAVASSKPAIHTVHLPDGSTVVLNTGSRLDYPTAFTGKTREVYLSGEGYFDIRSVPGQPFLVHSGQLTTRVLGTTFDIKAYPGQNIDITVTRGKVQVLRDSRSLGTLVANQQIHFVPESSTVRQARVDTGPIVAWKPSEIFYDNITMDSAARNLALRFGVTVTFTHETLKACRVTATFSPDDGIEEILTVLCGVTQSTYVVRGKTVTLEGNGCP